MLKKFKITKIHTMTGVKETKLIYAYSRNIGYVHGLYPYTVSIEEVPWEETQ